MLHEPTSKVVQATSCYRPSEGRAYVEPELVTTIVCEDGSVWTKPEGSTMWELVARPFRDERERARQEVAEENQQTIGRIEQALRNAGYHVPPVTTDLPTTIEVMLQNLRGGGKARTRPGYYRVCERPRRLP